MTTRQWFDDILFGLRELFARARTSEEIDLACEAVLEVWRLERSVEE